MYGFERTIHEVRKKRDRSHLQFVFHWVELGSDVSERPGLGLDWVELGSDVSERPNLGWAGLSWVQMCRNGLG